MIIWDNSPPSAYEPEADMRAAQLTVILWVLWVLAAVVR